MGYKRAITRTTAIIIVAVVIIAAVAGVIIYLQTSGAPSEETPTSPATPAEELVEMTIGNTTIRVPIWLKEFADKCRAGEIGTVDIYLATQMMPFEVNITQSIIDMFMQEFPCIKVHYDNVQNLKTVVAAAVQVGEPGKGPDIFTWAHDWTGEMADAGYIIPLDNYLPKETLDDLRNQYLSIAFQAAQYKLSTWGLPWAAEAIALVINTRMVNETPETFDEMKAIMEQYYDPANEMYGLAYQFDPYFLYPWITAFGGFYYDEINDEFGINSTGTEQGIEFYIRNILPYLDYSDLGHEHQLTLFTQESAPMIITGPWDMPSIKESLGEENIKVVPIPDIDPEHKTRPFSGIKLLWLTQLATKGDPNRLKACLLFVIWYTLNDNVIYKLMDEAGFIPVKLSVLQYVSEHKDQYPIIAGFAASVAESIPMPKGIKMSKAWYVSTCLSAILNNFTSVINAGGTLEEAINSAVASIDVTMDQCMATILESLKETS